MFKSVLCPLLRVILSRFAMILPVVRGYLVPFSAGLSRCFGGCGVINAGCLSSPSPLNSTVVRQRSRTSDLHSDNATSNRPYSYLAMGSSDPAVISAGCGEVGRRVIRRGFAKKKKGKGGKKKKVVGAVDDSDFDDVVVDSESDPDSDSPPSASMSISIPPDSSSLPPPAVVSAVMSAVLSHYRSLLSSLPSCSGATPSLLDGVMVACYGDVVPLSAVAQCVVKSPNLMTVHPFDGGLAADVGKAIGRADLGLNPTVEGEVVVVPVPKASGEAREGVVRRLKGVAERTRNRVRAVRRDVREKVKKVEGVGEDEIFRFQKEVDRITKEVEKEVDEMEKEKEREVLEV